MSDFEHRIEFVDDLPHGQAIQPLDTEGALIWLVRRGQMSEQLRLEVNDYLLFWVQKSLSEQPADAPVGAPAQDENTAKRVKRIQIEFVDHLPEGALVVPKETDDGFVWQIIKDEMTEQLAREVEGHLTRYLNLGGLVQRWGLPDEPEDTE